MHIFPELIKNDVMKAQKNQEHEEDKFMRYLIINTQLAQIKPIKFLKIKKR